MLRLSDEGTAQKFQFPLVRIENDTSPTTIPPAETLAATSIVALIQLRRLNSDRCRKATLHCFSFLGLIISVAGGAVGAPALAGRRKKFRHNSQRKFASAPQHTKCTAQVEKESILKTFLLCQEDFGA